MTDRRLELKKYDDRPEGAMPDLCRRLRPVRRECAPRPTATCRSQSSPERPHLPANSRQALAANGRIDALAPEALQALMAALCKLYGANIEAGNLFRSCRARRS